MIDESALAWVLKTDDISALQRAGISEEHFFDECKTAWKYLKRMKRDHDSLPSRDTFQNRFPDISLPKVKQSEFPIIVDQLKKRRKFVVFMTYLNESAGESVDFENVTEKIQVLQGKLNTLAFQGQDQSHLRDFFGEHVRQELVKELKARRRGEQKGIPTGLKRFDRENGGLQKQTSVVVIGRTGIGKMQPLDAPILTPTGWSTMGEMTVGTEILCPDGSTAQVTTIYPQGRKRIYRVTFHDGSSTEVGMDHLWFTRTHLDKKYGRPGSVKTTREIAGSIKHGTRWNHYIPLTQTQEWPDHDQPLDPYLLGALLGNGHFAKNHVSLTTVDSEIAMMCEAVLPAECSLTAYPSGKEYGIKGKQVWRHIGELGLRNSRAWNKHIPQQYLFASSQTRLAILQGLLDTDGCAERYGTTFNSTSPQLIKDVQFLVQSLGGTATATWRRCTYQGGKVGRLNATLYIRLPSAVMPFRLSRKADKVITRQTEPYRRVVSVEFSRMTTAQCITIDHPDHLYITDDFIVTHNSWIDLFLAARAVMAGHSGILYPLEMSLSETAFRLYTIFSAEMFGGSKTIKNLDLQRGHIPVRKVYKLMTLLEDKFAGSLQVADIGMMSDPYTVERIEAEVEAYKPEWFWVDYITLLKPPPGARDEQGWQSIQKLSGGISSIAKRRNCVGGMSAQVNREALKQRVFLPKLEHISFGDSIGHDAHQVFSINRDANWLYYALVKNRGGMEIGKMKVKFNPNAGVAKESSEQDEDDA